MPQVKGAMSAVYVFCITVVALRSLLSVALSFYPISNIINSLEELHLAQGRNLLPLMIKVSSVYLLFHLKAPLLERVCERPLCKSPV